MNDSLGGKVRCACAVCGIEFEEWAYRVRDGRGQTCSIECMGRHRTLLSKDLSRLTKRFWKSVDKETPVHPTLGTRCWLWTGCRFEKRGGYGAIHVEGKAAKAHRVAWFLEKGEWPTLHLCHACDNPPCVRFDHLFEGTSSDNAKDKVSKQRQQMKLTPDKVARILELRSLGERSRDIAAIVGVSRSSVYSALSGRLPTISRT